MLPEDRVDVHVPPLQGGGITVQGPSVLVRKKVGDNLSLSPRGYYEDMISSASIDVKLSASPYHETRKQESGGVEYLHGKTTYSAGFINSREPDYKAEHHLLLGEPGHVRRPHHRHARATAAAGTRSSATSRTRTGVIVNDPTFHQRADHRGLLR